MIDKKKTEKHESLQVGLTSTKPLRQRRVLGNTACVLNVLVSRATSPSLGTQAVRGAEGTVPLVM